MLSLITSNGLPEVLDHLLRVHLFVLRLVEGVTPRYDNTCHKGEGIVAHNRRLLKDSHKDADKDAFIGVLANP